MLTEKNHIKQTICKNEVLVYVHHIPVVDKPLQHLYSPICHHIQSPRSHPDISLLLRREMFDHQLVEHHFHCTLGLKHTNIILITLGITLATGYIYDQKCMEYPAVRSITQTYSCTWLELVDHFHNSYEVRHHFVCSYSEKSHYQCSQFHSDGIAAVHL